MPKYGFFDGDSAAPMQTFEGDKLHQEGEYVYVYKGVKEDLRQVAAVRLGPGQVVKEIDAGAR